MADKKKRPRPSSFLDTDSSESDEGKGRKGDVFVLGSKTSDKAKTKAGKNTLILKNPVVSKIKEQKTVKVTSPSLPKENVRNAKKRLVKEEILKVQSEFMEKNKEKKTVKVPSPPLPKENVRNAKRRLSKEEILKVQSEFMDAVRDANSIPPTMKVSGKDIQSILQQNCLSALSCTKNAVYHCFGAGEKKRVPSQDMYAAMLRALGPDGDLRSAKTKIGRLEATHKQNEIKMKVKDLLEKQSSKGKEPASSSSSASTSSGLKQFYRPSTKPVSMFSHAFKCHVVTKFYPNFNKILKEECDNELDDLLGNLENEMYLVASEPLLSSMMNVTVNHGDSWQLYMECKRLIEAYEKDTE